MSKQTNKLSRITDPSSSLFGLLSDFEYIYDEHGFIDWKSIIPKEFLFVNEQKFKELGRDIPESIDDVDDSMIIIKLSGIKWLARLRGYSKVNFSIISQSDSNVVTKCSIDWIPNFENPNGVTYEEIASCNEKNSDKFNLQFAEAISANRSFVRCVRNFLNIGIVGEEEFRQSDLSNKETEKTESRSTSSIAVDPQSILLKISKEKGLSESDFVDFCLKNCSDLSVSLDGNKPKTEKDVLSIMTPKMTKILLKEMKKV